MRAPGFGIAVLALASALVAQDDARVMAPEPPASSSRMPAAPELPAAPSATQYELSQQHFRAALEAPPDPPRRLTANDKFQLFVREANSPFTFAAAGAAAGVGQATDSSGFGQGWHGYQRRYTAAMADSGTYAFFSKFLIPVLARQDPRFKRNGREPFGARVFSALRQVGTAQTDEGDYQFNYSQVLGTAVSASIANLYYPRQARGFRRTGVRTVTKLATEAGANVVREFLPDVKRAIFGQPKVSEREREALTWRTGTQPSVTPER